MRTDWPIEEKQVHESAPRPRREPRAQTPAPPRDPVRLRRLGKFFFSGNEKILLKGVTYGAFEPDEHKREYQDIAKLERDFTHMAAQGMNAVRIPHTMPPVHLLDVAKRCGLRVMVGLSAEQYVGHLIDHNRSLRSIDAEIRAKVRNVSGHPALLCYALGNEISAHHVRWLGRRRIERYLQHLCDLVREEDPAALVTYVNYPTTEYLQLPFLDFLCFNVYLESHSRLDAYVARLQNLAGDRPLVMSELGLDSIRNTEEKQAQVLDWQIRTVFAAGCAGAFVFSWTDEWFRGGAEVHDWAFGLTRKNREPKPALTAVKEAYWDVPFASLIRWPKISVVVCTYNGARTLRQSLAGLARLNYPEPEIIVVNDGSTDNSEAIARESGFRVISTPNRGLSHARNVGWRAAQGEIVAFVDDDAWPDADWLKYLAAAFMRTDHGGFGGPNIPPPGNGWIADAVARAPGGPTHILLSDRIAEHIPGCNMAFRRSVLEATGGFDERFRVAGDDVDFCWRVQNAGYTIGFCPTAVVWHHRRNSLRAYWKQQTGYGKSEALLEEKWPEKFNAAGHVSWGGRIYGQGLAQIFGSSLRIYYGTWGTAPFQSLHQVGPAWLLALVMTPEWLLLVAALAGVSLLGAVWAPLLWATPLCIIAGALPLLEAVFGAAQTRFPEVTGHRWQTARRRVMTALLFALHPVARLTGRIRHGLTLWRNRLPTRWLVPRSRKWAVFSRMWVAPEERLSNLETLLKSYGAVTARNGDYEPWDLEVRSGAAGAARLQMAIEDQGSGTQYVRVRCWPLINLLGLAPAAGLGLLALAAAVTEAWLAAAVIGVSFGAWIFKSLQQCASAQGAILEAIREHEDKLCRS